MSSDPANYIFFWKPDQPNGWASQWYPSPFEATLSLTPGKPDEKKAVIFPTAEHWMMVQKALLFEDEIIALQVLAIQSTEPSDLKEVKALGRKVKQFDEQKWDENKERIVMEGNLHKFRPKREVREMLLATDRKILVESSPNDAVWGIGLGSKSALALIAKDKADSWRGQNLLGKILMKVRDILRDEENPITEEQAE